MTKGEGKKLASQIIDYFVKLCGFERRRDIRLYINDDDWHDRDWDAVTLETPTHGLYDIVVVLTPETIVSEFVETVCHELAHVFTSEYKFFYHTFVGDPEDGDRSISQQIFDRDHETVAKRLAVILSELWGLREGKNDR